MWMFMHEKMSVSKIAIAIATPLHSIRFDTEYECDFMKICLHIVIVAFLQQIECKTFPSFFFLPEKLNAEEYINKLFQGPIPKKKK